ncbi:hypothetical protein [Thermopetrobacter sp. TC1]|uniref:hypothetical protein n=1 Tax=Thermopetrobacter sp. TC1 TaxID=1495045 RepID=UPI00056DD46D|nr:hypothetical protein [Thermopetrobacter sp. TC1]
MPERNERTLFDMLAMILRGFSVLTWITLGVTGYVWFSSARADGVPFTVWGEALGIAAVFIMSLVIWWYAGFVARKGRERQGTLRYEDD